MDNAEGSESRENVQRLSSAREEALEAVRFSDESSEQSRPAEPPPSAAIRPPSKHAYPFSHHVLALLAPFAMFGLLARLGLQALTNFDGGAVFPLAWVQGVGCFFMGIAAGLREPLSQL
jgi:CrcB protein